MGPQIALGKNQPLPRHRGAFSKHLAQRVEVPAILENPRIFLAIASVAVVVLTASILWGLFGATRHGVPPAAAAVAEEAPR
jgi:hypothetical protein